MSKSKARIIAVTFIIFVVFLFAFSNDFAKATSDSSETANWKVTFTNERKDLKETKEIVFRNVNNQNVVSDKIAPGSKMKAEVEIYIEKTDTPVEIYAQIDDYDLEKEFSITEKIDNNKINYNQPVIANKGEKKLLTIELEWNENTSNDVTLQQKNEITIPIKIEVCSHI